MSKDPPRINKQLNKLIYFSRNQINPSPFQAYLKPRNRNTTEEKLLPKFFEQFKNTDFGIHFLVNLASRVF